MRTRGRGASSRVMVLLLLAVALGIAVGVGLPRVSDTANQLTGGYVAVGDAAETLERLTVEDGEPVVSYDRDAFGFRATDVDGNGCDVRDDVLARDLRDVRFAAGKPCQVEAGVLDDPYTGKVIDFVRGVRTSSAVQIDHVVALENAWRSGAWQWDTARRYEFGNDMYNLLAVDGPANQEKGSASAAYWVPTNGAFRCDYVARQIGVKAKYGLSVTGAERQSMLAVLHGCPGQQLPRS